MEIYASIPLLPDYDLSDNASDENSEYERPDVNEDYENITIPNDA